MESSHVFGDREKCSSSESGWTMYLSSPMHHEDDDYSDDDDEEHDDDDGDATGYDDGHEDSDDSLASDASSGPSRPEHHPPCGNGDDNNMAHIKYDKGQQHKIMFYPYKKPFKQMEKKRSEGANKVEDHEDDDEVMERTSPTTVHQSGSKVRKKTNWMPKRK